MHRFAACSLGSDEAVHSIVPTRLNTVAVALRSIVDRNNRWILGRRNLRSEELMIRRSWGRL